MSKIYDIWFKQLKLTNYMKMMLMTRAGSFKDLFEMSNKQYIEWGLSQEAIDKIQKSKETLESCFKIEELCSKTQIEIIGYFDEDYPCRLREIPDAPSAIYIKGNKKWLSKPMVAIVGARKCSEQGDRMARRLARELSEYGMVIVSGLALGIDAAGHQGALMASGGTVGVLGTGCNRCYPESNRRIYDEMIDKGCLLSEYEPDTEARPYHFPMRNRLISGLGYGIVVVEAAQRSGSLITAKLALDYGREVFAVPGPLESKMSQGTNELIACGARRITCGGEIMEELAKTLGIKNEIIKKNSDKMHNELAQAERIVYAYVSQEPILLDKLQELLVNTQLSCERLYTSLLKLEVKGLIKRLPGERYVRI